MKVTETEDGPVCEHGTAVDVHCCNCHSGFLFNVEACVCRSQPCDLECGERFWKGSAICRHGRTINQAAHSLHRAIGLETRE